MKNQELTSGVTNYTEKSVDLIIECCRLIFIKLSWAVYYSLLHFSKRMGTCKCFSCSCSWWMQTLCSQPTGTRATSGPLFFFFFYPEWNRIVLRVIGTTCVDPTISTQNDCWGKDLLKVINAEIQSPEFTSSEGLQVLVPVFSAIRGDESDRKDSVMTSAPPWPRGKISGPTTQAQRVRETGFSWVVHCRLHHRNSPCWWWSEPIHPRFYCVIKGPKVTTVPASNNAGRHFVYFLAHMLCVDACFFFFCGSSLRPLSYFPCSDVTQ